MTSEERRKEILVFLTVKHEPTSASAIASKFGVSRQVIVGDIALLRAAGEDIVATPRGYVVESGTPTAAVTKTIACIHNDDRLKEELYTVVDLGGGLVDVTVEHPVYGYISAKLHIYSRYDADEFCKKLSERSAPPLSMLTGGIHLHTLTCPSNEALERILIALHQKGFLLNEIS
ncbi:MAG: transcription repressor NadR [Oscillospiraceae bacterium]